MCGVKRSFEEMNEIFRGESDPNFRSAKDPWGHSISVRKSDMQKAIRRNNPEQALVAFYVCFNMVALFPGDSRGKRVQTNILNRVIVCAVEDIGVANLPLVYQIIKDVGAMVDNKTQRDGAVVASWIVAMCESPKTRIQSHLSHSYGVKNCELAKENGIDQQKPKGGDLKDPNYFRYVFEKDQHPMVWTLLMRSELKDLFHRYKKAADRNKNAFLQFALARVYFGLKVPFSYVKPKEYVDIKGISKNQLELAPKEEAYDMHTGEKGMDKRQFREVGSIVENQDPKYFEENLYKIYLDSNY